MPVSQPQMQTHHQVIEEIMPDQLSDEAAKEVINQYLPQRKRKPRQPKAPGSKQHPAKVIKLEQASGSEQTVLTTVTTSVATPSAAPSMESTEMVVEVHEGNEQEQQVTEMIEQIGEEQIDEQNTSGTVTVKTEGTPKMPKEKSLSMKIIYINHY